jgi:transcriptional accessory protein Tex/SPT6
VLDRTRIHPELYAIAKRMCKSALDHDNSPDIVEKAMQ